ncbi:MAG: hypothetical protein IPJ74_16735 [Saprospiraceae bacterium]|nr:hypothetical protein [Saprospiraceae bacterium]
MMKKVAIILFLGFSLLNAQTSDVQELLSALQNSPDNAEKVDILVSLSAKFLDADLKKAEDYAQDGLKLAEKLKYPTGIGKASIALGKVRLKQNQVSKAANNFEAALPWAEKNAEAPALLDFYFHLAQVYQRQNKKEQTEIIRQKYNNLQLKLQQNQVNQSNQEKIDLLQDQFSKQKDSASLARLEVIKAQSATDSALNIISQQEAILNKQRLELVTLENETYRIEQEKLQTELQLEKNASNWPSSASDYTGFWQVVLLF